MVHHNVPFLTIGHFSKVRGPIDCSPNIYFVLSFSGMNWLLTDHEICSPDHLGCFPNPDNRCQYFECAMNYKNLVNCSQHNRTDEKELSLKSSSNVSPRQRVVAIF